MPVLGLCVSRPPGVASESVSQVTCDLECGEAGRAASPVTLCIQAQGRKLGPSRLLTSLPSPLQTGTIFSDAFELRECSVNSNPN